MSLNPPTTTTTTTTSSNSSLTSSSSSSKGNGNGQACAACKYQRRKCAPDCILAPYFPHDSHRQFLNAHKLFGVSNITKIIKQLDSPAAREQAMRTIIFQSDARAAHPVGGCYHIIQELLRKIEATKAELDLVNQDLAVYRAAAAAAAVPPQPQGVSSHHHVDDHHLAMYNNDNSISNMHHDHHHHLHHQFLHSHVIGVDGSDQLQASQYDLVQDDVSSWVVQDSGIDVKPSVGGCGVDDHDDQDLHVKPLLEIPSDEKIINGIPANFEPHHHHHHQRVDEAMLMRTVEDDNVGLKEEDENDQYSIQQNDNGGDGNDLRDAATLFTLKNCTT
ncbi:LOB domain-containing protein 22-like [Humulus lupulus]|uniref:LOB domain-containing protein 22-like n=1 Tax=Humulus lupulus TaxID=3486 RepID=UPI002B40F37F|nr:LOB domain-containing protein 22-like [Humulus lupulus]